MFGCLLIHTLRLAAVCLHLLFPDGNFLAIGSHDNYIYIYAVSENGKKYSRVGKCSVSVALSQWQSICLLKDLIFIDF